MLEGKEKTMKTNKPVEPFNVSPGSIVHAAEYLEKNGMSVEHLRKLHHSPRRDETFALTIRYFGKRATSRRKNMDYGARLMFVETEHRKRMKSFSVLIEEALQRWPRWRA